jgi:dTDP-4-dehydrorhamnose 3,5-epimerase
MEPLGIEGAWVFTPQVHRDDRGSFLETFRGDEFAAALGYRLDVAQVNCSVSRRGVLRGIHYADVPPGQAKYVCCLSGAVVDVVVDLRAGSPSFGKWEAVRLDDSSRRAVFLAEGLGHGFMAVSDQATVTYLCSTPYAPGREHGVNPLDPALGIGWPLEEAAEPVLSDKDAAAPSLDEALRDGLLPRYADCVAYSGELRSRLSPAASRLRRQPRGHTASLAVIPPASRSYRQPRGHTASLAVTPPAWRGTPPALSAGHGLAARGCLACTRASRVTLVPGGVHFRVAMTRKTIYASLLALLEAMLTVTKDQK